MTNHDEKLTGEDELFDLFARRRPDADAFRAAVEARIRSAETVPRAAAAPAADETAEAPRHTTRLTRAASATPLLTHAGAKLGATKGLSGLLLWPVLLLATAVGVFAVGARSIRKGALAGPIAPPGSTGHDRREAAEREVQRTAGFVWGSLLTLTLISMVFRSSDLMIVWLVVTMGSLTYGVRQLATQGFLVRREVARVLTLVAGMPVLQVAIHGGPLGGGPASSDLGVGAALASLPFFALAVDRLAHAGRTRTILTSSLVFFVLLNIGGLTYSSAWGVRWSAARVGLEPGSLRGWEEVASAHRALRAVGAEVPDVAEARTAVREALDAGADLHPVVWTAAIDMDLLEADDLVALAELEKIEPPTASRIAYGVGVAGNMSDDHRFEVETLVRVFDLDPEQHDALTRSYLDAFPSAEDHGPLIRALRVVRALEVLGADEEVRSLRAPVHALLLSHWRPRGWLTFAGDGGFTSDPEEFSTSFGNDTLAAVELMTRFGAPDDIDLRALQSYLREEARAIPAIFEFAPYLRLTERSALLRLREEIGLPERSWLETLLAERLLLTLLLCGVLAVYAVAASPLGGDEETPGAQP